MRCRSTGGDVLLWQTVGAMQVCSSSPWDAVKLIHSKIIWQTRLMPVILLQNPSTDLFQASQIFMCPGKHQIAGFFASSEFCIDSTCLGALLSDMKTLFFISLVKFFCKECQLLKMQRVVKVVSSTNAQEIALQALGSEHIFLAKQRMSSSQSYPQQLRGDQNKIPVGNISLPQLVLVANADL